MADLYDRLFPADEGIQNISTHLFEAAMVEYMAERITEAQMVAYWQLDSEAQADLTTLLGQLNALTTTITKLFFLRQLASVNIMTEAGLLYNNKAAYVERLGL